MNRVITSPQNNRPKYTKQMIEHLSRCIGIENYKFITCVEPDCEEVISLLSNINFCEKEVIINKEKLTCNINTLKVMYLGFKKSKYILHIEDDVLISKDALQKYEEMINIDGYFSYGLYSKIRREDYTEDKKDYLMKRDTFVPWAFGISEKCFLKTLEWNCYCPEICHYNSWDCRIDLGCKRNNYKHLFTFLSRSNNIGAENGIHVPSKEWHRENQYLEFWADSL